MVQEIKVLNDKVKSLEQPNSNIKDDRSSNDNAAAD
jgi:hypothetical protein